MATTYLSPLGNEQQNDQNGAPLSGGKIFTYAAGTLNPIATYMDNAGAVTQANPIVLNTSGLPANPIWLPAGQAVKMVFQDVNGVALRTVDNIVGINDPSGASTADQWVIYQGAPTFISSTSFSVAGDQRNTFQIGRRVRTANSGGTVYGYISNVAFSTVTTVTVVNDSGVLDSGLSVVSYGLLSYTNPSLPGFLSSIAANGYQKLPSGLIVQWGRYLTTAATNQSITLPIPFPNAKLAHFAPRSNGASFPTVTVEPTFVFTDLGTIPLVLSTAQSGIGLTFIAIGN
jgi:hypothetical protein